MKCIGYYATLNAHVTAIVGQLTKNKYCKQDTYIYFKYPISVIYIIRTLKPHSIANDNIYLKCQQQQQNTCN